MNASGLASIRAVIAKWRVPNNQTPFTTEARARCADELEAALSQMEEEKAEPTDVER